MIRYAEISQIGSFAALSAAWVDYLAIDPTACTGGGDAPLRTTIEDAPGLPGVLIEPPLDSGQIITISGDLTVTSNGLSSEDPYFQSVENLYQDLKTSLDELKLAPGDLIWPGGTLKVWKQAPLEPTWTNFYVCRVTFSVIVDVFA